MEIERSNLIEIQISKQSLQYWSKVPYIDYFQMEQVYHEKREQSSWIFKAKLSHCEIWEHSLMHTIAEAYPIENYEETHARINRNKSHLVNSFGAIVDNHNNKTLLLIERIPSRLSELSTLSQSQTLKVLFAVFKGLEQLEENYGHVHLTPNCICFNQKGKVKVWVNPDLSSLHPVSFIKQKQQNKTGQILCQILKMVESKCFNTSFLRVFDRKLQQNKILSYKQAYNEILKIGEILFIDIQQKTTNLYHQIGIRKNASSKLIKNEEVVERDHINSCKPIKITNQNYNCCSNQRTSRIPNHSRKLSTHDATSYNWRYEPLLEDEENKKQSKVVNQNIMNINVNRETKFFHSQIHRSAPLSPREELLKINQEKVVGPPPQTYSSKEKVSLQKTEKFRINSKKQNGQNRKEGSLNRLCSTIQEVSDDSFSYNLKVDEKEIKIQGEFQTFGLLDVLDQKKGEKVQIESPKFSDINVQEMDLEIQKKLEIKAKQRKDKRSSLPQPSVSVPLSFLSEVNQKDVKTYLDYKPTNKQNAKSTDVALQTKREKLSSMTFIDQKYEQYIERKKVNQIRNKDQIENFNHPPKSTRGHSKHMSNFQYTSNFNNSKVSQYSNHLNSNNNYFNLNSLTSRNYKFGDYRIPTQR